jgi:hypothetical protein
MPYHGSSHEREEMSETLLSNETKERDSTRTIFFRHSEVGLGNMKLLREGSVNLGLLSKQLIWRGRKEEADGEKLPGN